MINNPITAIAHPNIAFIKYWGNRNQALRLPANGSISMNLAGLETRTTVTVDAALPADSLTLNGQALHGPPLERVSAFLDVVRGMAGIDGYAHVSSENNFPMGAGIASSAAAFAALSLAASAAYGLSLDEAALSRLARHGSGSACRSVPGGFVEWLAGDGDATSYAASIAPADHWLLADCVAVVAAGHKTVGSTAGHTLAGSSPLQNARLAQAEERLTLCRQAILGRDFDALAEVVELDSNLMHAVMMTSTPPLFYWQPATLGIMQAVEAWRSQGLPVCYTIDAGPNVHVLCPREKAAEVQQRLAAMPGVQQVLTAHAGGRAHLLSGSPNH
ncbi:MAG: diphosphomevalonate decarboxylase [Anaerolineaceae bacterium]|nr:diphosphomevalonate decarboxylase [Anaerolineaceae bacterium]